MCNAALYVMLACSSSACSGIAVIMFLMLRTIGWYVSELMTAWLC